MQRLTPHCDAIVGLGTGGIELAIPEGTGRLREASLGTFITETTDGVADR
jgi:hypothetical protein